MSAKARREAEGLGPGRSGADRALESSSESASVTSAAVPPSVGPGGLRVGQRFGGDRMSLTSPPTTQVGPISPTPPGTAPAARRELIRHGASASG